MSDLFFGKPVKGILKKHDSSDVGDFAGHEAGAAAGGSLSSPAQKEMKWDEMNILITHHPEGKTYGHMKIDEPKTPFSHMHDNDPEVDTDLDKMDLDPVCPNQQAEPFCVNDNGGVSASSLAARLKKEQANPSEHVKLARVPSRSDDDDDLDESELSPEERDKRREFKEHRKKHYNEYQMVQKAKELLEQEQADAEEMPFA
ncbi:hypothetical protein BV898_02529 [Hypsibius exemplaris]|uniref:Protein phosphatase inhibitor 2 n=1 Tax=Hypsibius exemplaris TaxID=2072580 RepID=A0A1W0X8D6_HYPEX|nr:hypothetical protein BV898_02529 [Hypsibius exemplaris]